MPLKTLKYVILDADTRTLEFFIACYTMVFGIWVLVSQPSTAWNLYVIIGETGGKSWWGISATVVGFIKLFTLYYKYPLFRIYGASLACILWTGIAISSFTSDAASLIGYQAVMFLLASFWIIVHRTAVSD